MITKSFLAVFAVWVPMLLRAQLQPLIVDFGHDWGSAWYRQQPDQQANSMWRPLAVEDLNGNGITDDDYIGGWALDFDVPLSPNNIVYDYTYPSARFYGAAIVSVTDVPAEADGSYKRPSAPTEGHINQNHELRDDWNLMTFPTRKREPEASKYAGALLVYWEKADFLNGGDGHRVSMDADSSIGVFVSRYWGGINWGRWVIRDQGRFYISEATFAGQTQQFDLTDSSPDNGARNPVVRTTHTISPAATRWAVYTPEEPHRVYFDAEAARFEARTFENVDAVGFLAQRDMSTGHPVAGGLWDLPHGVGEPIALKFNAVQVRAKVERAAAASDVVTMRPVGQAFWMAETPVSFAQWLKVRRWAVTNQRARNFTEGYRHHEIEGYSFYRDGAMGAMRTGRTAEHHPGEPVTSLSWHDAVIWCNALSELEGLQPAYYADAEFTKPLRRVFDRSKLETRDDRPAVHWNPRAGGYRLPTPAEFAAANPQGTVAEFLWDVEGTAADPAVKAVHRVAGGPGAVPPSLFPYEPFEGCPGVGFRVVRNGGGGVPAGMPGRMRELKRGEVAAPARVPSADDLQRLFRAEMALVRAEEAGSLPENDNPSRNYSGGPVYALSVADKPVSFKLWNLLRQWAETEKGYRFNYEGDMGSVQYFTEETAGFVRTPQEPVTQIAWVDAVVWCNALSELFGLEPVYVDKNSGEVWRDAGGHRVDSYEPYAYANTGRYTNRPLDTAAVISLRALTGRSGFRLPTLAEMEALTDKTASPETGWFRENSGGRTHPVGTKPANALRLYDVEGNVQVHTWGGNSLFGQIRFGKSFADHSGTYPHSMTRMESPHVGRSYVGIRPVRREE